MPGKADGVDWEVAVAGDVGLDLDEVLGAAEDAAPVTAAFGSRPIYSGTGSSALTCGFLASGRSRGRMGEARR